MSEPIQHFDLPKVSGFAGDRVLVTTPSSSLKIPGGSPVRDLRLQVGPIARWGDDNLFPQNVITDISTTSIIPAVLDKKVDLLTSGGIGYGFEELNTKTGTVRVNPVKIPAIDDWMEDTNASLFVYEAARDYYTYYNIFPEIIMGRGKDRVVAIECKDASFVRLGVMNDRGDIPLAYLADWGHGATLASVDATLTALNPYFRTAEQAMQLGKSRYILPIRLLDRGRHYYGISPWNGLRVSGWLDVAKRIPQLKMQLLKTLMHLRYHFVVAPEYWPAKYPDWDKKNPPDKLEIMKNEVEAFDKWAKGADGQAGTFWSSKYRTSTDKPAEDLVTINEMKMSLPEGAYLQDAQEAEFIICRDLQLEPSLMGISPSKSGSSPGSGSQGRVARTNHILDNKRAADMVLKPFQLAAKINGWPHGLKFFFNNYYAATLDDSLKVGDMNSPRAEL